MAGGIAEKSRMVKKAGRPRGGRKYRTFKMDVEILRKATHLAAESRPRISVTEFLNRLVDEAIEKPYAKYLKKVRVEGQTEGESQ